MTSYGEMANGESEIHLCFVKFCQTPKILYDRLFSRFAQHDYQTRHAIEGRFILPKGNTSMMQNTVMHRAIVRWNSLPSYIANVNTKDHFKSLVKQFH